MVGGMRTSPLRPQGPRQMRGRPCGGLDKPTAIFDYKFGARGLSQLRIDQIIRVGKFDSKTPIFELKPWLTTKRN
jgi:hypothetical protein